LTEPDADDASRHGLDAPRVTVVIPTWNAASTVERAVASVLEERLIPLECVVVDDASTDGTVDAVGAIAKGDPRVRLLRLAENRGVSNARNRGLAFAQGTWVAFLDADDRLLPGAIDALLRPTSDPEVLAVVGQRIWTDGERTWTSPLYENPDIREPGRKSIAAHPGLVYYAAIHGKVFHRSLIGDLEFEGRVLGDQAWTLRALLRAGERIEVIAQTVYEWTVPHPDRWVETITSGSRASADRSASMVAMAPSVYSAVSAEIDLRIDDPATRKVLKRAYLDRLIRSDLTGPVKAALDRHDPETGRLYTAMAVFLESVPAPILASSDLLVRQILWPPLRRWRSLEPSARSSYRRMVRARVLADRATGYRTGGVLRFPARMLGRILGDPLGTTAASAVVAVVPVGRAVVGRLRRS
jgi:glycosyltransferase involved in cell wall biosynthesis